MHADTIRQYCLMMATYNTNANMTLYEACASLSDEELKDNKQAFFSSIHGTLNHIMVADDIWMARFKENAIPHQGLDIILYDSFSALRKARASRDQQLSSFFETVGDDFYGDNFTFTSMAGDTFTKPLQQIVSHFFNHQTHHRGQVHTLLSQAGIKTPVSDLPYLV